MSAAECGNADEMTIARSRWNAGMCRCFTRFSGPRFLVETPTRSNLLDAVGFGSDQLPDFGPHFGF